MDAIKMQAGYAFELPAGMAWNTAHNDDWDIVVYTPTGEEAAVGIRRIDGARCRVFARPNGTFRAQLLALVG